jgi:hypothetical protein
MNGGAASNRWRSRRVSLANLSFDLLAVGITGCCSELLTKASSFLIALSSSLYLAVTFSHRDDSPFLLIHTANPG